MGVAYSEDRQQLIIDLYQSGKSIKDIAKEIKAGKNSVNRFLRKVGLCRSDQSRFTKEESLVIARAYDAGATSISLADKYDCSEETVRQCVINSGFKMRQVGGIAKDLGKEKEDKIMQMWTDGYPKTQIARAIGIPNQIRKLDRILSRLGISAEDIDANRMHGKFHHYWKGGRFKTNHGYIRITLDPDDPYIDMADDRRHIVEHRYIMAKHLGRPLEDYETVHHIDGNRENNDIDNLQLRVGAHGQGQITQCRCCGSSDIRFLELDFEDSEHTEGMYFI